MEIKGKKVLVFGSGISGIAAAALLLEKEAEVVLYDGNAALDAQAIRQEIRNRADGEVEVILG